MTPSLPPRTRTMAAPQRVRPTPNTPDEALGGAPGGA
jgi:hypothetical protein